eukprot:scaffold9322_cov120-Isochrysis_galbana.AAC.8
MRGPKLFFLPFHGSTPGLAAISGNLDMNRTGFSRANREPCCACVLVLAHFAMAAAGRSACERSRILATPVHTCTTKPLHARRSGPFRATQNQKSTLLFLDQQTFGPGVPTKVMVSILKVRERARVEVSHVVVDPLLPKKSVITEVTRQPLQRIDGARSANLGVARGVAHRSARRWQLSAYL